MCKCTPEIRTPFCGAVGCEIPEEWKISREEGKNDWRPIETAPRDGTPVLLWDNWEKAAFRGCYFKKDGFIDMWHDGFYASKPDNYDRDIDSPIYLSSFDSGEAFCLDEPTHWQPLPDGPEV